MIQVFKIKYIPPTDKKGTKLFITRINDNIKKMISFDYSYSDVNRQSIIECFLPLDKIDIQLIEFIGQVGDDNFYALNLKG